MNPVDRASSMLRAQTRARCCEVGTERSCLFYFYPPCYPQAVNSETGWQLVRHHLEVCRQDPCLLHHLSSLLEAFARAGQDWHLEWSQYRSNEFSFTFSFLWLSSAKRVRKGMFCLKKVTLRLCLGCGLMLCYIKTQTRPESSCTILLSSLCRWTLLS